MTHDRDAVRIIAAALWDESEGPSSNGLYEVPHYDGAREGYEKMAAAILDAITPMIVAAEREACAVLCDEAAAAYTDLLADAAKVVGDDLASMGSASAGACRSRAAAIRARKP